MKTTRILIIILVLALLSACSPPIGGGTGNTASNEMRFRHPFRIQNQEPGTEYAYDNQGDCVEVRWLDSGQTDTEGGEKVWVEDTYIVDKKKCEEAGVPKPEWLQEYEAKRAAKENLGSEPLPDASQFAEHFASGAEKGSKEASKGLSGLLAFIFAIFGIPIPVP